MRLIPRRETPRHSGWGKFQQRKTHCAHGHPYDAENTRVERRDDGRRRTCRTCDRERKRKQRERA